MPQTLYLLFFAANLVFIATHLYGWLLKWYYKPKAYSEDFHALFPATRAVGTIYLLQLLELPYLMQTGLAAMGCGLTNTATNAAMPTMATDTAMGGLFADALFFANAFALLVFAVQMLVMCELYFFPRRRRPTRDYWLSALPATVVLLPLLLQAAGLVVLPQGWRLWATIAVGAVAAWYFWRNVSMALSIGREVRRVNEATFADTDDFPVRFAQYIQWMPMIVLVLLTFNFALDSPVAKAVRDVLFTVASILFCIYTLNPRRKLYDPVKTQQTHPQLLPAREGSEYSQGEAINDEQDAQGNYSPPSQGGGGGGSLSRLSDDRYDDLRRRLESLLTDDRIYTEQHITADMLMQRLGTNANYLTEVIQRSGYTSFYDMVNQHRVRHAIALIRQHPDRRMCDVATECGFATTGSMYRAFSAQGKPAPSTFRKQAEDWSE